MITEALSNFVSLNQSRAVGNTLLDNLKRLHESLVQIDIDIEGDNSSSVLLIQKQLRMTVVQLEANLTTEKTSLLDIAELLTFIEAFKTTTYLNKDFIKDGIKTVEAVYLQKSALVAKKSKKNQSSLKKLSVLTLFPALAWLAYTMWLHLGSGFDVVYHEIQWPRDAYVNSWIEPNTYKYSASYQTDLNNVLAECYLPSGCSSEDLDRVPVRFEISSPFFKYNEKHLVTSMEAQQYDHETRGGVVFRSQYFNHQKTIRPINKVSLAVTPLEEYLKGWWIPELKVDVNSEVSVMLTHDKRIVVNTDGPIFNVLTSVEFTEYKNNEAQQRQSYTSRFFEVDSTALVQDDSLVDYEVIVQEEGTLYLERPVYLAVKEVGKLNADIVKYEFCFGIELGDHEPEDNCTAKAYKIDEISEIEQLPQVIKRQYHSARTSYQLLDKSKRTTQLEMSNVVYYIHRSILLNKDLPEENQAIVLPSLLGAIAEVELPVSPEKGESEMELGLTVDFEKSRALKQTLYFNEYLASGGHLEVFGHIKNLVSGRYKVETSINNEAVHAFTIEYVNPENERYIKGDGQAIWGITEDKN